MKTKIRISILAVIIALPSILLAQGEATEETDIPVKTEKPQGMEYTALPLPSYNSDDGFGMGLRVQANHYDNDLEPYDYSIFGQLFKTTKGYEYHIVEADILDIFGSPFRIKARAGFERTLNAQYYGYGNYHDMQRQDRIIQGRSPTVGNIPESRDLIQVNDEFTLNENFIDDEDYSIKSDQELEDQVNPGRRVLRERQNKYYNYDRIRPFFEASSEDFFPGTNFKWFLGTRVSRYKIQSYWGDKDGGEAEQNTKTLIDIEQPEGYDAVYNMKWVNTLRAALVYDSRPRLREKNPNEGFLMDIHVEGSGRGTGSDYSFTRVTGAVRQYVDILPSTFNDWGQELVFSYRLLGQETFGNVPFYEAGYITPYADSEFNEGLGSKRGIRGYAANQFVDRVMTMLNTEVRYTISKTSVLGGMDFMLIGYYDIGRTAHEKKELTLKGMHRAYGGGLRMVWKRQTIINISYGRSTYGHNLNFSFNHPF